MMTLDKMKCDCFACLSNYEPEGYHYWYEPTKFATKEDLDRFLETQASIKKEIDLLNLDEY